MQSLRRLSVLVGLGTFFSLAGLGGCSGEDPVTPGGIAGSAGTTASGGSGGASGGMLTAGTTGTAGTTAGGSVSSGGASAGSGSGGASAAGSGGASAGSGSGGTGAGLPGAKASKGCGKAATQPLEMFVNYKETITPSALVTEKWQNREYWVRLPAGYDPNRPYPTVFVGPGCGGKGNNAIPIQKASGNDAIVVGIDYSSAATGRDCFMTESFPDPEVNYVEETAANVKAAFCVDESRLFIEGFSSGSWIAYMMGCVGGGPGGLFKGNGTATGNWQGSLPDSACKGPIAFMGSHDSG
ncbi:MAG TPA: hypothetical protein VHP33_07095, partial [Polyangiaceae bacterium]|nr:hypothetical protein [Polyangiaceae bacterium]